MAKRFYDLVLGIICLAIASPIIVLIAIFSKLSDRGPVFYSQQRVGLRGRSFYIHKFRTMIVDADKMGLKVTQDGDPRITWLGRILRKTKLDELPQLWNIVVGEMSFVGPRPEVQEYVDGYTPRQAKVLQLKPGITSPATLAFRHEEDLLKQVEDVDVFYREFCVPRKIELNLQYAESATLWSDSWTILKTVFPIGRPTSQVVVPPPHYAARRIGTEVASSDKSTRS